MPSYDDVYNYLRSLGASHAHAAGAAINAGEESGFNPAAMGDQGTAHGLFQFRGDRAGGMKRVAGDNWQDNWKGQIDYAVSEPVFQEYLRTPFEGVNPAASWFTQYYERPAEKHARARNAKRGGMVSRAGQPHGSSSSPVTVPAAQIAQGPAYQGGGRQPVSSTQGSPVQQPNIPPRPAIPQMPTIDPAMFEPSPTDYLRRGLLTMAAAVNGGKSSLAGAIGSNAMGGYGNYAAMMQLQMKAQDRQYKQQMQQWEQQRDQALIQSFPEEERGVAAIIGPTEYMKQKVMADLNGPDQTTGMKNYEYLIRQKDAEGNPVYTPEEAMDLAFKTGTTVTVGGGPKLPSGYMWTDPENPSAGVAPIPGGPATQPTEGERKAESFGKIMQAADEAIKTIEVPSTAENWWLQKGPNFAQSEEGQKYANATEAWVLTYMRDQSGAEVPPREARQLAKVYFPQPGDSDGVIEQKEMLRKAALESVLTKAGRAAGSSSGQQGKRTLTPEERQELEERRQQFRQRGGAASGGF
jgi:hypothetical protein